MLLKAISLLLISSFSNLYIFTDSHGLTWISSVDGIYCHTGVETKIYKPSEYNLVGKNVQSNFHEDSISNIWFVTYKGLNVYDRCTDDFLKKQFYWGDTLLTSNYKCLGLTDSIIWINAGKYLFAYDVYDHISIDSFDISFSDEKHSYAFKKGTDTYLFTGEKRIRGYKFDNNLNYQELILPNIPMSRITNWKDTILLAAMEQGLWRFDLLQLTFVKLESFFNTVEFLSSNKSKILLSKEDSLILCDDLSKCKLLKYKKPTTECYLDKNNVVWVTSDGSSPQFFKLDKKKFDLLSNNSKRDEPINASAILEFNGSFWVSTRHDGVYKLNSSTFEVEKHFDIGNKSQSWYHTLDMIEFQNGLYVKGQFNVFKYNEKNNSFNTVTPDMAFLGQLFKSKSDKIYLLEYNEESKEIYQLKKYNSSFSSHKMETFVNPDEYKLAIQEDLFGNLYTSVDEKYVQVLLNEKGEFGKGSQLEELGLNVIWHSKKESPVYLGNSDGLYKIWPNNGFVCEKVMPANHNLDLIIYSILGCKNVLWLGTSRGLASYDIITNKIHFYTLADGIQGMEYNTRATYIDENGYFYFGGVNGVNRFHPDSIKLLDIESDVYISSIEVNNEFFFRGKNQNTIRNIELNYEQNTILFTFNSLDFSDPEATRVQYILSNYESSWDTSSTNKGYVRYPNLPPGEYDLLIKASNSDGIWNPTPRTIHITILPPWYATWWARSLGVLLISGLIYLIFWFYYKRQLREKDLALREANLIISQQKALSEERTRIAAEMHDDLGGGLTSIRFLSQKVLRIVTNEGLKNQVARIVNLSEGLVNNMSEIIWAMDSGLDSLSSLISYVRRYTHEYLEDYDIEPSFKVIGKPTIGIPLSGHQRRNIFLVVKEAIHNTVKHAQASALLIQFNAGEDLIITIKDNGIGFPIDHFKGNGLSNMKKRVEALGGNITFSDNKGLDIQINVSLQ